MRETAHILTATTIPPRPKPPRGPAKPLTLFPFLSTRPDWLALPRNERCQITEAALAAAFPSNAGATLRFFDAEAFSPRVSDVALFQAETPDRWHFAMERLRDTPLLARSRFDLAEIIPAYENGHKPLEAACPSPPHKPPEHPATPPVFASQISPPEAPGPRPRRGPAAEEAVPAGDPEEAAPLDPAPPRAKIVVRRTRQ